MRLCAASLITGGMDERHPNLRIAFSHGGGVLPVLLGRLNRAWQLQQKLREALPRFLNLMSDGCVVAF
jgi:aminocarboxymuconate-semialdehyde decarboxylase